MPAINPKTINYYWAGAGVLFLFLAVTFLFRPILDPDFFWHLKTGEWIWQHGTLPTADPFTFTGPASPDSRQLQILQGYWLAQLLYFGLYSAWGWWGIYLLRLAIVAGFLGIFLHWIARERPNAAVASSAVLLFFLSLLEAYPLERPQAFSFLFFGVLLSLYAVAQGETARHANWKNAVFVFFLMAIWANLHGGVVLGQLFLLLSGTICLLRAVAEKQNPCKKECLFYAFGMAGSLLRPVQISLDSVLSIVNAKKMNLFAFNFEYYSMYQYFKQFNNYIILFDALVMILSLVLIINLFKKKKYAELLIFIVICIFSVKHVRYIPFVLIMFVLISTSVVNNRIFEKTISGLMIAAVLIGSIYFLQDEFGNYKKLTRYGFVNSTVFPVRAADFILQNKIDGKIFNSFAYGGYLLWRLGPEQKIMHDGRVLNETAFIDALSCEGESGAGRPFWKDIMDKYGISVAVLARISSYELTASMAQDPDWKLLYYDETSVVLSRKAAASLFRIGDARY